MTELPVIPVIDSPLLDYIERAWRRRDLEWIKEQRRLSRLGGPRRAKPPTGLP